MEASSPASSSSTTRRSASRRPSTQGTHTTTNGNTGINGNGRLPPRILQACSRCRRMKLKCSGGAPCARCQRAGKTQDCDSTSVTLESDATARIAHLENIISTYLLPTHSPPLAPHASQEDRGVSRRASRQRGSSTPATQQQVEHLLDPSPTTSASLVQEKGPPGRQGAANNDGMPWSTGTSDDDGQRQHLQQHQTPMDSSQRDLSFWSFHTPSEFSHPLPPPTSVFQPSSHSHSLPFRRPTPRGTGALPIGRAASHDSPEYRLAIAQDCDIAQPFFGPLDGSSLKPSSSEHGNAVYEVKADLSSDPVERGVIPFDTAEALVRLYFSRCHMFLPIIILPDQQGQTPHMALRESSSFLYSAVLAVAARFHQTEGSLPTPTTQALPHLAANSVSGIRQIAFSHLTSLVLRKRHDLADIQATLIMSAWGLTAHSDGPDPWLLTGIVQRLSFRLQLELSSNSEVVTKALGDEALSVQESSELKDVMNRWRTHLSSFYYDALVSFGYCKPLSKQSSAPDVTDFVHLILKTQDPGSLASDLFIASQVELAKIAQDLVERLNSLTDWPEDPATSVLQNGLETTVFTILRQLNVRLEQWSRQWIWTGSLHSMKMGSSVRMAKLQGEHIRLSLNSIALKSNLQAVAKGADADLISECVTRAVDAAINMINMYLESSKSDQYLCYTFEFSYNALAQAALYLIRVITSQTALRLFDRGVLVHFLSQAINELQNADLSVTRHGTDLARICRDIALVASIEIPDPQALSGDDSSMSTTIVTPSNAMGPTSFMPKTTDLDLEAFLQLDSMELDWGFPLNPLEPVVPHDSFGTM